MSAGSRPLLSAAIIVRDEADHLRECLTSIREVCDEIVVVDTGSTDESVAVARSFGAVTGFRAWDDDFAAARNAALDRATGRWILYIDADERLEPGDVGAARHELERNHDAVSLRLWFRVRPEWSPFREFRLWQHRPDIRFEGRIHETMVPDIQEVAERDGLAIRETDAFRIVHLGYEGDQTRKHLRNLPLLERRVEEYPDRCYLWNHLAEIRMQLGDVAGARDAWESGLALIRGRGIKDRTDAICYAGYGLSLIGDRVDVADLMAEAFQVAPWYLALDFVAARNHAAQRRWAEAIPHLRRLLDIGSDPIDTSLSFDNRMFTTWAWELLADCQLALGDRSGAAATYSEAARHLPSNLEYRTKAIALASGR